MDKLAKQVERQKAIIKQGGWKKYLAYVVLAALFLLGISVVMFKDHFLRRKLAKAQTEKAIANEKLAQDLVDDQIRDLDKANEAAQENINKQIEALKHLNDAQAVVQEQHNSNKELIKKLSTWEDVDKRVEWDDEENSS